MMDLGSVHERAAALFTVWLAQYAPAAAHGDEDHITVSRLQVGERDSAGAFYVGDMHNCEAVMQGCLAVNS